MLRTEELEYHLPEDRIALEPATPRDAARLMVVDRSRGQWQQDAAVRDLPDLMRPGDLIVFNTTRVVPARLLGKREDTGGAIEGLFLSRATDRPGEHWRILLRAKKVRSGMRFVLDKPDGTGMGTVRLEAVEPVPGEAGAWLVRVEDQIPGEALGHAGHTPLPPYILKAREHAHLQVAESTDRDRYQTVYAREPGSVAAPTAGLHFTPELLESLARAGVRRADVILHVGTGTFRPIETDVVESHPMHSEHCEMSPQAVREVLSTIRKGGRVLAVGTTTARTLESYAAAWESLVQEGKSEAEALTLLPQGLDTKLLITPGYRWRWVSGLLTNFHLPRSTLLAMVGAFLRPSEPDSGLAPLKTLYGRAVDSGYRFYSYGDAMLII